jgi:protein-disulfide isomerase
MDGTKTGSANILLIGLSIGLILGGAIGYLYASTTLQSLETELSSSKTQVQAPPLTIKTPSTTSRPAPIVNINMEELVDDDPWFGNPEASVVIVEFSDFQCPFCERATATVRQIRDTYGDDILFVYRDFPIHSIHPQAQKAAEGAQCADDQGKFWDYHDILFEKRTEWAAETGVAKFKEYAADLSLDTEEFNSCLDTGKYASEVGDDLAAGQALGVTGTPTFFINGIRLVGAQPFTSFQGIIDQELAKT